MPITVKHAPSAEAMGGVAYTAGRGQRRERDIDRAIRMAALNAQLRMREWERIDRKELAQGRLSYYNRAVDQRTEEAKGLQEGREADRAFRMREYEEAPGRALEAALQQQKILRDNFKWEYTQQQKDKMGKLQDAIAWVREQVSKGDWTPEQGEEAERQLQQQFHSITPSQVYHDEPKPQEIYNSRIVTDPVTGIRGIMDDKGNVKELPGEISFPEYGKLYTDTLKAMFKQTMEGIDITDYAAVEAQVANIMGRYARMRAGGEGGGQGRGGGEGGGHLSKLETDKTVKPAKREVVAEVDLKKLDERAKHIIEQVKAGDFDANWVRKEYGAQTAAEWQYIVDSGNEQVIANALHKLGVI